MQVTLDRFDESLRRLERAIRAATIRGEDLFADLALLGFARDVFEHGVAVRVLWESDVPRACYAPARAAFEAFQEVVFLGTRKDDYDYWGARAHVGELLDSEKAGSLAEKTNTGRPECRPSIGEQIAQDEEVWAWFAPDKAGLLKRALADAKGAKGPGRFHWTGKTRAELPREFLEQTGGDEQTVAIHRSYYNILSCQAHPSPRIDIRSLRFENGVFIFNISGDAAELAGAALASTFVATESSAVVLENRFRGETADE